MCRLRGSSVHLPKRIPGFPADDAVAKWLGRQSYLDDLASLDPELYKGLVVLKNYPQPEELSLSFTITEEEFGVARSVDLIPNGSEVAVTAENRHECESSACGSALIEGV